VSKYCNHVRCLVGVNCEEPAGMVVRRSSRSSTAIAWASIIGAYYNDMTPDRMWHPVCYAGHPGAMLDTWSTVYQKKCC
jgi:hypothetical protein